MTGQIHGKLIINIDLFTNRYPPPPSVNQHSLSEIFGSVGIFKTIEYTQADWKNYRRVRQLINISINFQVTIDFPTF